MDRIGLEEVTEFGGGHVPDSRLFGTKPVKQSFHISGDVGHGNPV